MRNVKGSIPWFCWCLLRSSSISYAAALHCTFPLHNRPTRADEEEWQSTVSLLWNEELENQHHQLLVSLSIRENENLFFSLLHSTHDDLIEFWNNQPSIQMFALFLSRPLRARDRSAAMQCSERTTNTPEKKVVGKSIFP